MGKLLLGFAAGWWVATRQAHNEVVIPPDVWTKLQPYLVKGIQSAAGAVQQSEGSANAEPVATQDHLVAGPGPAAEPMRESAAMGKICIDSFNNPVNCETGELIVFNGAGRYGRARGYGRYQR